MKYQFKTPEEKTRNAMEKLKIYKLLPDANDKTAKVIGEFFKEQQKMLDGAIKNGVTNVEAYKAKKAKLAVERDDKLKKIFTKEQFANWVTVIEPSLSSKRPAENTASVKG
ncbi:MAG: hypothetical protein ABIP80_00830 [Ferruginibacter sp.]